MAKKPERKQLTPADIDSIALHALIIITFLIVTTDWFLYDIDGKGPQNTLFGGVGR